MQITRRTFLQVGALSVLTSGLACRSIKPRHKKPNIIFIMADDLGYGHLGCYGQTIIQTPQIDRIAQEGMRFTRAYSGCSVCAPARCSLMTGYHAGHISVRGNGGGVSLVPGDVTIAEILKKAGYVTGVFGKWGLGEAGTAGIPNEKGFDEFFGYLHQLHAQFYYPEFLWDNKTRFHISANASRQRKVYSHDLIMDRALNFIRRHQDQPFFLYLPVTIPHHEFIVPEESLQIYSGRFAEQPLAHWRDGYALPKEPKATFAAMVTHLDGSIGNLLTLLQDLQLDHNTIIFLTSDNGPANGPLENPEFFRGTGGLRGYKGSLYEGGIRVPLVVRWRGHIQPSSQSEQATYFPDILPTLADLAGAVQLVPGKIDGLSIVPTLLQKGQQQNHEFLYWETADYQRVFPYQEISGTLMQAVKMQQFKAVKNGVDAPIELYNLANDPEEKHDIAAQQPQIIVKMKSILETEHQPASPQVDMTATEAQRLYIPGKKDKIILSISPVSNP